MNDKFIKAFGDIQNLFRELLSQKKITPDQATRFNIAQKTIVNYHIWVNNQLDGNIKVELPWEDPEFKKAWKLWRDFKKEQFRFTYKPIGEVGALNDLADLSNGDMNIAIAIIHKSIKKGWRGFFALRENTITKNLVDSRNVDYKKQLLTRLSEE